MWQSQSSELGTVWLPMDYLDLSMITQKLKTLKSQNLSISVQWIRKRYFLWATLPIFLFRHTLMPRSHLVWYSCGYLWFLLGKVRGWSYLMLAPEVPLWFSGRILHQGRWQWIIEKLDLEGCIPVSYPNGLATITQFCEQLWWLSSPLSHGNYGPRHVSLCQMHMIL